MPRHRRRRQKGSGEVFQSSPGAWAIRWREGKKRRFSAGFRSRDEAERVLAKVQGERAMGRAGMPPSEKGIPCLSVLADGFLGRREITHRSAKDDRYRWDKHLGPAFGHLKPSEVNAARIRAFVEDRLSAGLASGTIRILVALLSALFVDLVERGIAQTNPARGLPRSTMRLMKSSHDPRTTPFIEKLSDVRRIFLALPQPLNIAYAVGALAGLRTGEVFALRWDQVDLASRRIHVRESVKGPLKDKDSRVVPILDVLVPVLAVWKLKTGGTGLVVPALRRDGKKVDKLTPGNFLRPVLKEFGLARPGLGWYEATRHTFASQWVMNGGSIEKLKEMLGHYSVVMTERYAHLKPELFTAQDLAVLCLDLAPGSAETGAIGQRSASPVGAAPVTNDNDDEKTGAAL